MRMKLLMGVMLLPLAFGCAQPTADAPIEVPPGGKLVKLDLPGMT